MKEFYRPKTFLKTFIDRILLSSSVHWIPRSREGLLKTGDPLKIFYRQKAFLRIFCGCSPQWRTKVSKHLHYTKAILKEFYRPKTFEFFQRWNPLYIKEEPFCRSSIDGRSLEGLLLTKTLYRSSKDKRASEGLFYSDDLLKVFDRPKDPEELVKVCCRTKAFEPASIDRRSCENPLHSVDLLLLL